MLESENAFLIERNKETEFKFEKYLTCDCPFITDEVSQNITNLIKNNKFQSDTIFKGYEEVL